MAFLLKNLQDRLDSVFLTNSLVRDTGKDCAITNAMRNDLNAGLLQSKVVDQNGQRVDVKLAWQLPECDDVETGCVNDPCETGSAPTEHDYESYTIACNSDNTVSSAPLTFAYNDFLDATALMDTLPTLTAPLTETSVRGTSIEAKLLEAISKVDRAMEKKLAEYMVATVDATTFGFDPKEVPSLTNLATDKGKAVKTWGTGTAIQSELFTSVRRSAQIARYNNDPVLIGGFGLTDYINLSGGLCCSSDGINLGEIVNIGKTPVLYSEALVEAMLAEYPSTAGDFVTMPYFLSYDRGSMQILNFHTFSGMFEMVSPLTTRKQIFSPFTGRPMGLTIATSSCGTSITLRVQCTEDYVWKPDTLCAVPSYNNPNGLQQFVIKNS